MQTPSECSTPSRRPEGPKITVVRDYHSFFNRPTVLNKQSNCWFGSAMRQGNRLHFLTTMPIKDYLSITKIDQAPRGSTVKALSDHQNPPQHPHPAQRHQAISHGYGSHWRQVDLPGTSC